MFSLGLNIWDYILIFAVCIIMIIVSALNEKKDVRERLWGHPLCSVAIAGGLLFFILIFGAYGVGYDANQFIYNQF